MSPCAGHAEVVHIYDESNVSEGAVHVETWKLFSNKVEVACDEFVVEVGTPVVAGNRMAVEIHAHQDDWVSEPTLPGIWLKKFWDSEPRRWSFPRNLSVSRVGICILSSPAWLHG